MDINQNETAVTNCQSCEKDKDSTKNKCFPRFTEKFYLELIMFIYMLGSSIGLTFIQNLVLERFCERKYSTDQCRGTNMDPKIEKEVQIDAAQFLMLKSLAVQLPSVFLAISLGHWSDLHGRKLLMLVSCVGHMMSTIIYLVCCYFEKLPLWILFVAAIPVGIVGPHTSFTLGLYGHLKDITSNKKISAKISVADGLSLIGLQLGPLLGSELFHSFRYQGVFYAIILLKSLSFVTILLLVHDCDRFQKCSWKTKMRDLFRLQAFIDSVKALIKKRDDNKRTYILGANVAFIMINYGNAAAHQIIFLFTRNVAHWGVDLFNYYHVMTAGCSAIGCLGLMPILTNYLHLNDAAIGIIGLIFAAFFYFSTAFSYTTVALFTVVLFRIPAVTVIVTTRSFVAKCVSNAEFGKLLAIYSIMQAITSNVATTSATPIYVATIKDLPGAIFIICGAILAIPIFIYLWIYVDMKVKKLVLEVEKPSTTNYEAAVEQPTVNNINCTVSANSNV